MFLTLQESLARAVAEEMHKAYHNELGPEPVPLTVPGVEMDEEEVGKISFYFIFHLLKLSRIVLSWMCHVSHTFAIVGSFSFSI